jgi:hypothetical protein
MGPLKSTPTTLQPLAASGSESIPDPAAEIEHVRAWRKLSEARQAGDAGERFDGKPRHPVEDIWSIAGGLRELAANLERMLTFRALRNG